MPRYLLIALFFVLLTPIFAVEHFSVKFSSDISPHWFSATEPNSPIFPRPGETLAVGEISLGEQGIEDISHLRLLLPTGDVLPLHIEKMSLVDDMGSIVFFRYTVNIPTQYVKSDKCTVEMGNEITSPNSLISGIRLDAGNKSVYREITLFPSAGTDAGSSPIAVEALKQTTVTVIADRKVHHAQLLYLLPIVLVFIAALTQWCLLYVWKRGN